MLLELKVSDFAIIDQVHLHFKSGFNIISGETGAGKSILLKSLGLLMGAKARSESVRTGAEQATIEGCFDIADRPDIKKQMEEMGIPVEDDLLIVRRSITQQGKSRIYLNNSLSTLNSLRSLISPMVEVTGRSIPLIEMTGQHENKNLMTKSYHLELLDNYSGAYKIRKEYQEGFNRLREIEEEVEELTQGEQENQQKLDYLVFQKEEIENLDLKENEDQELSEKIKRLKGSRKISDFIQMAESWLSDDEGSVLSRLDRLSHEATDIEKHDSKLGGVFGPLHEIRLQIEDVHYEFQKYVSELGEDEENLDSLEDRLSRIRRLQKKLGGDFESIQSHYEQICDEINRIENRSVLIKELETEREELTDTLMGIAKRLRKRRIEGAKLLSAGVNDELLELNMKGLKFAVKILPIDQFTPTGMDDIEFQTKTSAKDSFRPLAKFASGGELSRILLSLKQVASESQFPRTYLFDEVDTGVSGETAERVGIKLKNIAKGQQVICVTHLPQVAAFGDHHFYIEKQTLKGRAIMSVNELDKERRVDEIARLISGEKITDTSRAHARELLG